MAELLVTSADGTPVRAESYGEGRPLVIVSGALFARERWLSALPLLAAERQPFVIDRRGRGRSGDSPRYAPEREVEDLLAVLEAIGRPVDVLGHSSGAILGLQLAARVPENLERLIAYEPPVFFEDADRIAPDLPERLEALLAAGEPEAAVETFLREGPRVPDGELRGLKASSFWPQLLKAMGHTVPYDSRIQRSFSADPAELARIRIPTLLLIGSASPARMQAGARAVAARLPNAQLGELPGQQHVAMVSAAPLFAAAVNGFLGAGAG